MCIICQQKTPEALKCPLNAWGRGDKSKVYASFLTNVSEFKQLNQLLVLLNSEEDMEVDQPVIIYQVKWHKSCHLKFCDGKLQRARKREHDGSTDNGSILQKRCHLQQQTLNKSKCIFCSREDGHPHDFRTFDADVNVRRMASDLHAFLQHCRRASYQAGIWSTSDRAHQELPSPDGYGWTLNMVDGGNLTALEAKYLLSCLTELRNRHCSFLRQSQGSNSDGNEGEI